MWAVVAFVVVAVDVVVVDVVVVVVVVVVVGGVAAALAFNPCSVSRFFFNGLLPKESGRTVPLPQTQKVPFNCR